MVDEDPLFANKLDEILNRQYPNEFKILYFPSFKKALTAVNNMNLSVLFLNDANLLNSNTIPKQCKTVLLTENRATAENSSCLAVCKYQSVDEWHTTLCSICKEELIFQKGGKNDAPSKSSKVCLFTSAGGGVGVSAAAAAYSVSCADRGKSVMYLNFESLNSSANFFSSCGKYNFDDVIYALRSKKYNLKRILEQAIIKDDTGVDFIPPCRVPADMFTVTGEELVRICEEISNLGKYDLIVVDMGFSTSENAVLVFLNSTRAVFVTNGTDTGNSKTQDLISAIPFLCGIDQEETEKKILLLYNRFESDNGQLLDEKCLGKLGGINKLNSVDSRQLIKSMAVLFPFERLSEELNV